MKIRKILPAALALLVLLSACAAPNQLTTEARETTVESVNATVPSTESLSQSGCDAVFFGDSITADSNFDELFPELQLVNLGVYGDTLEDLLRRVPDVRAERPARIFLLGGINCLREDRFERCVTEYAALLDALLAACPGAELIVQSVLPVSRDLTDPMLLTNDTVRRFNAEIEALAARRGCAYVDLWPAYEKDGQLDPTLTRDGLHLNFTAYDPWAELIAPYLPRPS